jgi:hypothetical protein
MSVSPWRLSLMILTNSQARSTPPLTAPTVILPSAIAPSTIKLYYKWEPPQARFTAENLPPLYPIHNPKLFETATTGKDEVAFNNLALLGDGLVYMLPVLAYRKIVPMPRDLAVSSQVVGVLFTG